MGQAYSISVTGDDHAENHSRRAYTPQNAEKTLEQDNIVIYDCGNDREAFNDFFRDDILAYNAKQKREDRKKSLDYLQSLEAGTEGYGRGDKREKPFYHHVLQIGNNQTLGVTDDTFDFDTWKQMKKDGRYHEAASYVKQHLNQSEDRKQMTAVLEEVGRGLQAKYPYCKFWGITIHRDEPHGTDHMDIRYTIFTDGEKTGLGKRVSMNKGLAKMGFKTDRERTALQKFNDAIKADIEAGMEARGYSRQYMDNHEKHVNTSVFQAQRDKEKAIAEKEEALAERNKAIEEKKEAQQDARFARNARDAAYVDRDEAYDEWAKAREKAKQVQEGIDKRLSSVDAQIAKKYEDAQADLQEIKEWSDEESKSILEARHQYVLDMFEFDEKKKEFEDSTAIMEETFRTMVRQLRGPGHEEDEIEVPKTQEEVRSVLERETASWQERMQNEVQAIVQRMVDEQLKAEREKFLDGLATAYEKIQTSADSDISRKRFMERTKDTRSGRSMEDVYQANLARKRENDENAIQRTAERAGSSLEELKNRQKGE